MENISDSELLMLIREENEDAKEEMLNKYKYIIDIYTNKYYPALSNLGISKDDIYSEALYGYTDAINSFDEDKGASFSTFLSLCVKRRIIKLIRKYNTNKEKLHTESYSLDYVYDDLGMSLLDMIKDDFSKDPMYELIEEEKLKELEKEIKKTLSTFEYEVYTYLIDNLNYNDIATLLNKDPKQVDNAIQRIRLKIKDLLN